MARQRLAIPKLFLSSTRRPGFKPAPSPFGEFHSLNADHNDLANYVFSWPGLRTLCISSSTLQGGIRFSANGVKPLS